MRKQYFSQKAFVFGQQPSTILHRYIQSPPMKFHHGHTELKSKSRTHTHIQRQKHKLFELLHQSLLNGTLTTEILISTQILTQDSTLGKALPATRISAFILADK